MPPVNRADGLARARPGLPAADGGASLVRCVERRAVQQPDAPALVSGAQRLSYADCNAAANALARRLLAAGVGPDSVVALSLPHDAGLPVAMLAVMKAGAAWLPLDPALPAAQLAQRLDLVRPHLLLTDAGGDALPWSGPRLAPDPADRHPVNPGLPLSPGATAYLMFTSGSAGRPKAVRVTWANLRGLFPPLQPLLDPGPRDVWSWSHSCSFGFSIWEIFGALLHGGSLVAVPPAVRADPAALCRLLREERVSVLSLTPSALRLLLGSPEHRTLRTAALRCVALSGEAVRPDDLAAWFETFGAAGPRLVSTYAITETAGQLCWREFSADGCGADAARNIGRPLAGRRLLILDEQQRPVPEGAPGELYVAGDCVAAGYVGEPALTAERFPELELTPGSRTRCYRTGDRARWLPGGEIAFVGRADEQLKYRGYRIEPGQIEAALRRHPALRDAAVGLRADATGSERLVAWLVAGERPAAAAPGCEFWPSLGGWQLYDPLLYDLMGTEAERLAAYREAFALTVRDRTVLDMGTGRDALLARLCAAAGARHVWAVEVLASAAAEARALLARLGLERQITLVEGDVAELSLPEPVEVCTQGIIGNIGSADGIVPLWNAIQPLLAPGCVPVPARCTTLMAACELPEAARAAPRFAPAARRYVQALFAAAGAPFDPRLCLRNVREEQLLSGAVPFEELDFRGPLAPQAAAEATLEITRDGRLDGVLLWTVVELLPGRTVDYLQRQQAWLPVFLPLADGIPVRAGDRLALAWRIANESDARCPDYALQGRLSGAAGAVPLAHVSRHRERASGSTPLHRRLLEELSASAAVPTVEALRDWLSAELPEYMLPSHWMFLPQLPLNESGKLDRAALPEPDRARPRLAAAPVAPRSRLEQDLAALWQQVLGVDGPGIEDDFFALGGDSIAAVQLTTALQRLLDDAVMLVGIFDAPSIGQLAAYLLREHPAAVARRYPELLAAPAPGPA